MKTIIVVIGGLIFLRFRLTIALYFIGVGGVTSSIHGMYGSVGCVLNPQKHIDAQGYELSVVSMVMVSVLLLLMTTGMPLGIVTLFVSVMTVLVFFGPGGLVYRIVDRDVYTGVCIVSCQGSKWLGVRVFCLPLLYERKAGLVL